MVAEILDVIIDRLIDKYGSTLLIRRNGDSYYVYRLGVYGGFLRFLGLSDYWVVLFADWLSDCLWVYFVKYIGCMSVTFERNGVYVVNYGQFGRKEFLFLFGDDFDIEMIVDIFRG